MDEYTPKASRCRSCLAAQNRARRAANPEPGRIQAAAWRAANPELKRVNNAAWAKANPGRKLAAQAAWRQGNPERVRSYAAAWYAANPGVARAREARARVTAIAVMGGCCVQCQSTEGLELDHINGGGGEHRRAEGQAKYVLRIARSGEPDARLQLLCSPCHWTKTTDENRARRALA